LETGILMLAAGFGRRFGGDKRLAELPGGEPLLPASARQALHSGLPLVVCLRPEDTRLAAQVQALGASVCFCPSADQGMGATLAEGMQSIAGWDAVLVALGDMPEVQPQTFAALAKAMESATACRPVFRGTAGHPVGFSAALFPALRQLEGDRGARDILRELGDAVRAMDVDDAGILRDIDTPDDLR